MRAARILPEDRVAGTGDGYRHRKTDPYGGGPRRESRRIAVLVALNALCGTGLPLEELEAMALPLGADVPFCLRAGWSSPGELGRNFGFSRRCPTAFGHRKTLGRVSTAAAFRRADELGIPATPTPSGWEMAIWSRKLPKIAKHLYNVLEPAAGLPIISELKRLLLEQGRWVR